MRDSAQQHIVKLLHRYTSFSVLMFQFYLQAVRAPLAVTVLCGYRDVSAEAWRTELPSIWPHLAQLIFSPQPSVRKALASLFAVQMYPMLSSH